MNKRITKTKIIRHQEVLFWEHWIKIVFFIILPFQNLSLRKQGTVNILAHIVCSFVYGDFPAEKTDSY